MNRSLEATHEELLDTSLLMRESLEAQRRVDGALARYCGDDPHRLAETRARLLELARFHHGHTGAAAQFIRTPGRINLIGEHTDYNGLPVLPMTVQRDLLVAFSPRSDARVVVRNLEPDYLEGGFALEARIPPGPEGAWINYVKAAWQALVEDEAGGVFGARRLVGADLTVSGNLPACAGLSSSSALVVSSALAGLFAAGLPFERRALAERLAVAEKYVGTEGGGMDQAITLLGRPGHALLIDFFPLRVEPVPLPEGLGLVASHSLVRASKTGARRLDYNLRPLECELAVALLNRARAAATPLTRLGDLENALEPSAELALLERAMPEESYSFAMLAELLAGAEEALLERTRALLADFGLGLSARCLAPRARARHALSEGRRARATVAALRAGDAAQLGRLLSASDASCHRLYAIGTPELARLAELCRAHGALGARLTGAGFGGFVISLLPEACIPRFLEALNEDYYEAYLRKERPELYATLGRREDALFQAVSTQGADRLTL